MPGIVQHYSQLIGVEPVAAANHKIADIAAQTLAVFTLYSIGEVILELRDAQAYGGVFRAVTGVAA
ncbi:hypothetical protein D3C84_785140 [compost metagenome]